MVTAMLMAVLFGTLCSVVGPGMQSRCIDIIAGSRHDSLSRNLVLMLAAYMMYSGSQLLQGLLSARLSQRIVRRLRVELFGKITDLPVRYLDEHSHGDVMSRFTNDVDAVGEMLNNTVVQLISGSISIVGTFALMVYTNVWLTVITIVMIPVMLKAFRR